jgi:hypothetical protein
MAAGTCVKTLNIRGQISFVYRAVEYELTSENLGKTLAPKVSVD